MSDDTFTRNTGSFGNMKKLALIAIGAACVLGTYSMSSQPAIQETFIQNDEVLALWKDIKVAKVNKNIDRAWKKAMKKTKFDGEVSKDEAKKKLIWVLSKFGK
jgi:hypothetical protein